MFFDKAMVGVFVLVNAHRQYHDAFRLHALLHLHQRRHLFDAGRAPCRPEVQHDNLPAKLAERDLPVRVLDSEIRRRVADMGWFRSAIAGGQEQQQEKNGPTSHTAIITNSAYGVGKSSAAHRVDHRACPQ